MSEHTDAQEREIAAIAGQLSHAWDTSNEASFHALAGQLWTHISFRYGYDFVIDGAALILKELGDKCVTQE